MYKSAILLLAAIVLVAGILYALHREPASSCEDCNVIIVGMDTLRADAIHGFGYERETTPNIDALMSHGVSFTNAIATAGWTVPSFMSMFTGLYPSQHKVTNKFVEFTQHKKTLSNLANLSPGVRTLADEMKAAGYATGGFTGDAGVSGKFGYRQGFDVYTDETTFGKFENSKTRALQWLDSLQKGQKFFMFVHGYDLHGQNDLATSSTREFVPAYSGPLKGTKAEESLLREKQLEPGGISLTDEDAAFWRGIYDSKLKDADAQLGAFIAELDRRGLMKKTVIVLVADHGEEFYEHKGFDHGHTLYDELVHVPLIIAAPRMNGGKKIGAQVSMMDVARTIFDIVGMKPGEAFSSQVEGRPSLAPFMEGARIDGYDVFTETDYRNARHIRSVRTADGWKYIVDLSTGADELYDLNADPGETKNLVSEKPEKRDELRRELLAHMRDDLDETLDAKPRIDCLPVYDGECM